MVYNYIMGLVNTRHLTDNKIPEDKLIPQEFSQNSDVRKINGWGKKKIVIAFSLITLLIFLLVVAAYFYLKFSNRTTYLPVPGSAIEKKSYQEVIPAPPSLTLSEKEFLINNIQERVHVGDQKNIDLGGTASSGFLKPSQLKKKTSLNKQKFLVKNAYAEEEEKALPFLFYVKNKVQIKAFDLSSGIEYELFDLRDFPDISIKENTLISRQFFLNNSKKIVFQLQEQLDSDKYKTSFKLYDIKTERLKEIVSTTGTSADPSRWLRPN